MTQEQMNYKLQEFKDITTQMAETYARKNTDYDDAFTKSLEEDGLLVAKIRLGDKYRRFSALIKQENQVKDESIEDTLLDMASYAIMTIMFNRNKN